MKKFLFSVLIGGVIFSSCSNQTSSDKKSNSDSSSTKNVFGKSFEVKNPVATAEVFKQIQDGKKFSGVMEGKIVAVCQESGCWADVELPAGQKIKVKFRDANDEEFFIDKNSKDKIIDVNGEAYMDTLSVDDLKHFAKDAGKSDAEINAIKNFQVEPTFIANGAVLKQ
jgi:Domain of unknown function (DUF4920)